jgi:hypothetical protein
MDTVDTLDSPGTLEDGTSLSTEDYWARMQALRADLVRLRPTAGRD